MLLSTPQSQSSFSNCPSYIGHSLLGSGRGEGSRITGCIYLSCLYFFVLRQLPFWSFVTLTFWKSSPNWIFPDISSWWIRVVPFWQSLRNVTVSFLVQTVRRHKEVSLPLLVTSALTIWLRWCLPAFMGINFLFFPFCTKSIILRGDIPRPCEYPVTPQTSTHEF